jgi:hypothetical protein
MSVRFATVADADGVMACLRVMHEENGLFALAEDRVLDLIRLAVDDRADLTKRPIIGVIGPPGDIEATICLTLARLYYTDEYHLADMWNFIRPDCRKKMHIRALLQFAMECSDRVGVPLMSGVVSNKRTEAKVRIYRRHFGPYSGAFFLYRPKNSDSDEARAS